MNAMAISNENVTIRSIKRARLYKAPVSSGVEMLSEDTVAIVNNVADMFEYSLLKRKKQSMNMKFEEYVLDRIKKGFKMKR